MLTVAIVFFAFCQLVITYSNYESSAKQVANLIIAANRINDAADSFSTSAADISRGVKDAAVDLGIQATSSQKAAKATKSVADTARSTLRISERAYITTALPVLVGTLVQIPIHNTGHVPSGDATVVAHEQTSPISPKTSQEVIGEQHWEGGELASITSDNAFNFNLLVPAMDRESIAAGRQYVTIAGTISYPDGIPDDAIQHWFFCYQTSYIAKQILWSACDPKASIKAMSKAEQYPKEKYHLRR